MSTAADRIARNDAIFREANERIRKTAEAVGHEAEVPFVCECAEESCTKLVRLRLGEYAAVRASPRRFLAVREHARSEEPHSRLVAEHDGWAIVEKVGRAGEVAAELDR